jgi:hypothetical protein
VHKIENEHILRHRTVDFDTEVVRIVVAGPVLRIAGRDILVEVLVRTRSVEDAGAAVHSTAVAGSSGRMEVVAMIQVCMGTRRHSDWTAEEDYTHWE